MSAPPIDHSEAARSINQRIFETSLDLILVVDRKGTFIRVSPSSQSILGYRPDEMVGRSAAEFLYPEDLESTRNELRMARRGRLMRNFDTRYVHKDGHVVTLAWTGVWSEPEQQHFFIGRDMTERIAAEERLRHAQRLEAVGQLTGGIAHDFNNLLGVIIGSLDLLKQARKDDPEEAEALAKDALEAALRGSELTGRLLAFARRQPLRPLRVDLNDLVTNIVRLLSRTLGENVEIKLKLAPDCWAVVVDPAQLESAIANLATNARDAMPRGGQLMIATSNRHLDADYVGQYADLQPGDYALIEITDTGTGVPPEMLHRIFEPFFTTKGVGKGTGLGLSMVFGFMKQSGGHINVYSELGHGTTFRLYLPRTESAQAALQVNPAEPRRAKGGHETILVVEDNPGMRRVVVRQLRELGYRVLEAENAAAALAILERERADLLFTDIVMPGETTGIELARVAAGRWPNLRVVLTSGFPDAKLSDDFAATSARLLTKPYRKEALASTLRDALGC